MKITLIVPCYNEEEILPKTITDLTEFLLICQSEGLVDKGSDIVFIDDGSKDRTWSIIENAALDTDFIKGVRLSRNKGHQNALLAGLHFAKGDFVISIDADLQDDIHAMKEMISAAIQGTDIVYGVRKKRETDTFFKRFTAETFYRIMSFCDVDLVFNHADFRGMSRRAIESLLQFKEVNLFLRGIIPQLGYKTLIVYYDRKERLAGSTKYPIRKMLSFAWQGITSFSMVPLKIITWIGVFLFLISIFISFWAIFIHFFTEKTIPGWTSTLAPLVFLSGIQLFSLGIIGEYIGKIYLETKQRPRFFISEFVGKRK